MRPTSPSASEAKLVKARAYLTQHSYDALIISRKDNFSWLTSGGDHEVLVRSEHGVACLIILPDEVILVAQVMDGPRILDEELQDWEVQYVPVRWYDESPTDQALSLLSGKRVAADFPSCGEADFKRAEIWDLHYPLSDEEVQRLSWLGRQSDVTLREVADEVQPGMRETEIANLVKAKYELLGVSCEVVLVGSDDRIVRYRHPNPSDKNVESSLLIHSAVRKWGLHANVTRMVHFGAVPERLAVAYDSACRAQVATIGKCRPGQSFASIAKTRQELLEFEGRGHEWGEHFPGAVTGYVVANTTPFLDPTARIVSNQAFDWFVTVKGAKVEELTLSGPDAQAILSVTGAWPTECHRWEGAAYHLPSILVR